MRIGVFANTGDRQARQLCRALDQRSADCAIPFDLTLCDPEATSMDGAGIDWNGIDLSSLDAAFLRGFSYLDPVIPSGEIDLDWSLWRADYIAQQMKYTYLYSLFSELERRGVRVINAPAQHLRLFMKAEVLERLRQAGLPVAPTLCTNSMDAAKEFCAKTSGVVWRPAAGRAAWQLFMDKQRESLVSLKKPPVLLAELHDGPLVRAYCFDGKPVLLLQRYLPQARPEAAEETLEQFFEVPCAELREELRRACDVLKLSWCQILFTVEGGHAWIYDVDADPLIEGLPLCFQSRLTELLAIKLLGQAPDYEAPRSIEDSSPQQRPTIFLRRMLQILFEFERSKYK